MRVETIKKAELESVGVEFECGYDKLDSSIREELDKMVNGFEIGYDSSVYVNDRNITYAEIKFWSTSVDILTNAVDILLSKARAKQNETCSNHRHVRFKCAQKIFSEQFKLKRSLLQFREDYLKTFQNDIYIARLNNYYSRNSLEWSESTKAYELARKYFGIRAYAKYHDKAYEMYEYPQQYYESVRYYFINFCSYHEHKTLEFRLYPHINDSDEFHQQSKHLERFIENFKPIYKIYRINNEHIDLYISRINRKYIMLEVKFNEIANKLSSLDGFKYRSKCDYSLYSFAYADRVKKNYRLSEIDNIDAKIIENGRLNYVVFRVIKGYWKLKNNQIENMKVKEFAKMVANEFENFVDTVKTKFGVI